MTEIDGDTKIRADRPAKKSDGGSVISDRVLAITGGALAVAAAFFPWYVFFNHDQFTQNVQAFISGNGVTSWTGRTREMAPTTARSGKADRGASEKAEDRPADDIVTATVPNADQALDAGLGDDGGIQPFPGYPVNFKLLHVANGRAMIQDKTGVYLVEVGSSLPDMSKVATFEKRSDQWVLVTDKGEIYGPKGRQD